MTNKIVQRTIKRLAALVDGSAWLMIAPAMGLLAWLDWPMAKTIAQWVLPAIAIAGIAVMISRVIFHQIDLTEAVEDAIKNRSMPAAVVAAAVIIFVGVVYLSIVLWAKA